MKITLKAITALSLLIAGISCVGTSADATHTAPAVTHTAPAAAPAAATADI